MAPIKQTLFSLYRWIKNPIKGPEKRKDDSKMDTNPIQKPMQDLEKCYHKICYWLLLWIRVRRPIIWPKRPEVKRAAHALVQFRNKWILLTIN